MDNYNGPGYGNGYSRGPTDINAYNQRVQNMLDLNKALQLAYAPGEATPEEIAALGVSPEIWAEAQRQDRQTSADRASWNFTSNMMPLMFLGGALGAQALGAGAAAGGGTGAAADTGATGLLGSAATDPAGFAALESQAAAGLPNVVGATLTDPAGFAALESAAAGGGTSGATGLLGSTVTDPAGFAALESESMGSGGGLLGSGAVSSGTGSSSAIGGGRGLAAGAGALDSAAQGANLAATGQASTLGDLVASGAGSGSWLDALGSGNGTSTLVNSLLRGIAGSRNQTTSQSGTKEPWGPAQDWMKQNIATGQQLQDWYQKHPFNAQQKAGLQNTLTDADNFRASVLPGLLDFANGMMGGQYQRQKGGAPGSGAGYGGAVQAGGYTPGSGHVFSVAPGQRFGTIDWDAVNPFSTAVRP